MPDPIVLAGSTGALGKKIARQIVARGGAVRAVVRSSSDRADVDALRQVGATVRETDTDSVDDLARACEGSPCVVSALAGLRPVIIDAQKKVLDGAVKAGVPRFFPSDFSIDFYKVPGRNNRNLDLRREFAEKHLEGAPVQATSILNGIFSEFVFTPAPYVVFAIKRSVYFGDKDQAIDLTAMDDAADYTAAAALDAETPRFLRIAGNVLTPEGLAKAATLATGDEFKVQKGGSIGFLEGMIKATKTFTPDSGDLYPAWQGMQYMRDMYSGEAKLDPLDNDRYPDVTWTPLHETLAAGEPDFMKEKS